MRRAVHCLLLILFAASAGAGQWFTYGLDGGRVNALAIDPANAAHLLAGTDNGLFATTDAAATWTRIHNVDDYEVTQVAIDPTSPSIMYVAYGQVESYFLLIFRNSKLFRSVNGGATWSEVTALGANKSISSLEVDAAGNVYAGFRCGIETFKGVLCETCASDVRNYGVARSTDHGLTWQMATGEPSARFRCFRGVTADSERPGVVYAHTWNLISGFIVDNWISTDGGATFALSSIPSSPGKNLLIHPLTKRRFAAVGGGTVSDYGTDPSSVVVSDDAGATWRAIPLPSRSVVVATIALDPTSPDTLYVTTNRGLYRTTNLGLSWDLLFDTAAYAVIVTAAKLYLGTAVGLMVSADNGKTWSPASLRDGAATAIEIAVDPNRPATLYAWIEDEEQSMSVARSTDSGGTWERITDGFGVVTSVGVLQPSRPRLGVDAAGTIYAQQVPLNAAGISSVARLRRGQTTWTVMPYPDAYASLLLVDPNASGTLYAFSYGAQVRKSVDGGTTWSAPASLSGQFFGGAAIDPIDSQTLFVAASGLWRSSDGGATWVTVSASNPSSISISPADHRIVWAFTCCDKLEKSTDGGLRWQTLDFPHSNIRGVVADALDPNTVYIWSLGKGIYRSTDGGATWSAFDEGLNSPDVNWMAVARNAGLLYAATFRRGVFTRVPVRARAIRSR
jgi:photosystem II stability/assembly factor-like uncharacterized protein